METNQIRDSIERYGFTLVKHETMNPNGWGVDSRKYIIETFYVEYFGSPIVYPILYLRSKTGIERFRYKALFTEEDLEIFLDKLREVVLQDIEEQAKLLKEAGR